MRRSGWLSLALALALSAPAAAQEVEVHIGGRVQPRYELQVPEEGEEETAFAIQRARIKLKGHAYTEDLKYKFQADLGKGDVVLKDFYMDYRLPARVHLRAGQWKRPFSRQQINSSGSLELVDRAITDKFFGGGRDIGVAVHNNYEKSPELEWALGVFNGTGDKPRFEGDVVVDPMSGEGEVQDGGFTNVPARLQPAVVGRVGYNHGGIDGYSEADLEGGPLRFAVGAGALAAFDVDDDDETALRAELDYIAKAHGFSTTGGVYVSRIAEGDFSGATQDAIGFHLQLGYLLGGRYQPAVRYAFIRPEGAGDLQEILGGLSVYFFGHKVKWQTDGGGLISETMGDSQADLRVRTQLQLAF